MECQSYIKKAVDSNDTLCFNVIMINKENKQTFRIEAFPRLTLLKSFVHQKKKNYVTPEKKGVPRGQSIGFPYKKYYASLLLLTTRPLKDIANAVKAPYGSLRNWCTEEGFIKLVNEHSKEFTELLLQYIEERANKQHQEHDEILKKSIEEISNMSLPERYMEDLLDMPMYSDGLLFEIMKVLVKKLNLIRKLDSRLKSDDSSKKLLEIGKTKGFYLAYQDKTKAKKILEKYLKHYDKLDVGLLSTHITGEVEIVYVLEWISRIFDLPRRKGIYVIGDPNQPIYARLSPDTKKPYMVVQRAILEDVKHILLKKPIKEKDRKKAVYLLTSLLQTMK